MATTDAIGSSTTTATSQASAYSGLSSDDFLKIIFAELSKQDPLQPQDTGALLEQLSSIRSIESDVKLEDRLGTLVDQNEMASAAGLLGRTVSGLDSRLTRVEGVVKSVGREGEDVVLTLTDGSKLAMSNLERVVETPTSDEETQP